MDAETLSKEMEKRVNAAEMWFLRRALRLGWESHTTNVEVLIKAETERKLMKTIKKQKFSSVQFSFIYFKFSTYNLF